MNFLSPVSEESCYTLDHCQQHCGQVQSISGALKSLPSIGPLCPEAFCLREKVVNVSFPTEIENEEEGLPRSALWRSCSFCLPSYGQLGNWATSIWTSGNRGGAQPQNRIPLQRSRRRRTQTSEHDKHQYVKGNPGDRIIPYNNNNGLHNRVQGLCLDKMVLWLFDGLHLMI